MSQDAGLAEIAFRLLPAYWSKSTDSPSRSTLFLRARPESRALRPVDRREFAGVGREQAERRSGNATKQAVPMPELRRQGSLLPAYTKINRLLRSRDSQNNGFGKV